MKKTPPSPEVLRQLLSYDPATGVLTWKKRPIKFFTDRKLSAKHSCSTWNKRFAGKRACISHNKNGYLKGGIFSRTYLAHRLIWALVYGEWPADQIDHINGIRDDNRITNLRVVSVSENSKNSRRPLNNTSGVVGVYWRKANKKWRGRIKVDGRFIDLGHFDNFDDAVKARKRVEIHYGFHPNHGRVMDAHP